MSASSGDVQRETRQSANGKTRLVTDSDLALLVSRLRDAAIAHEVTTGRGSLWGDAADVIEWLHGPRLAVMNALGEALRHFVHLDESNAAIHCGPVRYSPITFRLANAMSDMGAGAGDVEAVMRDVGAYQEDRGR